MEELANYIPTKPIKFIFAIAITFTITLANSALASGKGLISLNLDNAKTEAAFKLISDASGLNIVISQEAKKSPPLSLSLENVHWNTALNTIMEIQKLKARRKESILFVYSADEKVSHTSSRIQNAQEPRYSITKNSMPGSEPKSESKNESNTKSTKLYKVRHAKSSTVAGIVKTHIESHPGKSSFQISIDNRKNALLVTATKKIHTKILNLIELLDTPTTQIKISVKIIESKEDFQKTIGIGSDNSITLNMGKKLNKNSTSELSISPNQGVIGAKGSSGGTVKNFNTSIIAREREGKLNTHSTHELFTKNNEPVSLSFTTKQTYIITKTRSKGKSIPERVTLDIPKTLSITPKALADGNIDLTVSITSSSQVPAEAGVIPDLESSTIKNKLLVKSGHTVALGGASNTSDSNGAQTGIPGAKRLPAAGAVFRTADENSRIQRDYTVLITPQILPFFGSKPSK